MADRTFFDAPTTIRREELQFEVAGRPVPDGWRRVELDDWLVFRPPNVELPAQGWKIHVSACLDNADAVLDTVWNYCVPRQITFKFLCGRHILLSANAKYADRGSSGKFVTIYPSGEEQLGRILHELGPMLHGQPGPYILSDLRWSEGPLYVRYGGYTERRDFFDRGTLEPAIVDDSGRPVPDRREPGFRVPEWVGLPEFLAPHLAARTAAQHAQVLAEEQVADATGRVAHGLRDITACGAEAQAHGLVARHIDEQERAARRLARLEALSGLVVGVGGWMPLVLLVLAAPALRDSGFTLGAFGGAVVYLAQALLPAVRGLVEGLTANGTWLVTATARLMTATSILDSAGDRPADNGVRVGGGADIRLSRITFRYGRHADPVLDGFDLVVPDGEHLAIVGPSGVGKSTLAALLCGTLRPSSGEVLIGGVPLRTLSRSALARQRTVLPQEAYVFTGTVWENLTYYRPDATEDQLADSADILGATELVESLGGLRAQLDPANLSAGQRQLIALTRAYLSPARIVVLDEATCHLDPVSEARVERAFAERGGTLVVVAHRISSAMRARRVLVLDGHEPVAGDHDLLIAGSPLYRALVNGWQVPPQGDHPKATSPGVPHRSAT